MENLTYEMQTVTCHTENCENCDIAIEILVCVEYPLVICGCCGEQITDVKDITE
jgi:hypothetical protein